MTETAVFSNVELGVAAQLSQPVRRSCTARSRPRRSRRRIAASFTSRPRRIEAPNWLRDGSPLIYNSGGRIFRVPAPAGHPQAIDTGFATRCNNDHGVSPDGTCWRSATSRRDAGSRLIYTLPITGGTPGSSLRRAHRTGTAGRPTARRWLFAASAAASLTSTRFPSRAAKRQRLTTAPGLDDGPEYSPDGRFDLLQLRAHRHDANLADENRRQRSRAGHRRRIQQLVPASFTRRPVGWCFCRTRKMSPATRENKDVTLRMMTLATKKIDVLGRFFGGQGTINVPCWSPDGRKIAFVTYQLVPGAATR